MSRIPLAIGTFLVASLFAGCAAPTSEAQPAAQAQSRAMRVGPPPDSAVAKEQVKVTLEKIQQIQKAFPLYRAAVATPGFLCALDSDHYCHVTVTVFQSTDANTGLDYCIAVAPEFVKILGKNQAKQIVWEMQLIDPKTGNTLPWSAVQPAGSTLAFLDDGDRGIMILQNIYEGGNPNKPQLKDGKRGKSPTDASDKTKFNMRDEHKETGPATYLPIIVHTVNVGGVDQVALCGTPDPTIYNDN
jgi:hypothetical protein